MPPLTFSAVLKSGAGLRRPSLTPAGPRWTISAALGSGVDLLRVLKTGAVFIEH